MMTFGLKLTSPTYLEELPGSSGSRRGTSLTELMADGLKKFSRGVHGSEGAVSVGL